MALAPPFSNVLAYTATGMESVIVRGSAYRSTGTAALALDVYAPPDSSPGSRLPVVVFALGYPDAAAERLVGSRLKDFAPYVSWGRLVAARGAIGVTYATHDPGPDLEAVVAHVRANADALGADPARIAVWSCSANAPTAMAYVMREGREGVRAAVFYYGLLPTPDAFLHDEMEALGRPRGCAIPPRGAFTRLRRDLPILVVRAGRDDVPHVNTSTDHLVALARAAGVPVTLLDLPNGVHGFDFEQKDSAQASAVIEETLRFLRKSLGD